MPSTGNLHIVNIHGAGSNADFWHEQHPVFPDAHYLNLPGHHSLLPTPMPPVLNLVSTPQDLPHSAGSWATPNSGTPHSIDGYADWVAEYLLRNDLTKVVLVGHSMGGAIALTLALRHPPRLEGLILTGTGARLQVSPRLLELLRTDYPAAVEMILRESLPPISEPLPYKQKIRLNGLRRHILRTPQAVTLADYEACDSFDVMSRVGEIDVSTLCIVGAQDSMTPPKYSHYLHSHINGSRLEIVEGAGHMLPLEKPEEYNDRILMFLGEIGNALKYG